ncbi:MAG TPA: MarR family transcriptional regulator [Alphaproteobacteria bacterium]|jgi:DNA-binding MarR family transcriptional regulator|nr:MarR family transcriptional regulator [Alphaproteobacteria bacterium]
MFDLTRYLPYLINRSGAKLALAFGRELVRFGVTLQEWRVLAALAAHDGQRLSDLATLTSIDVSTLSRLVDRMRRKGLLARARANGDGRAVRLALTDAGRQRTRAIVPEARRYERLALRGIAPADAQALKRLLVRIYGNLEGIEG